MCTTLPAPKAGGQSGLHGQPGIGFVCTKRQGEAQSQTPSAPAGTRKLALFESFFRRLGLFGAGGHRRGADLGLFRVPRCWMTRREFEVRGLKCEVGGPRRLGNWPCPLETRYFPLGTLFQLALFVQPPADWNTGRMEWWNNGYLVGPRNLQNWLCSYKDPQLTTAYRQPTTAFWLRLDNEGRFLAPVPSAESLTPRIVAATSFGSRASIINVSRCLYVIQKAKLVQKFCSPGPVQPGGRKRIAQQFIAGKPGQETHPVPPGTKECP